MAFKDLNPKEAAQILDEGHAFVLDVRTQREFDKGKIEGATLIPVQELAQRFNELPQEKSLPLFVYCAHGVRSVHACNFLSSLGYATVYNMQGGLAAFWGREP